jgi:hypothetical protein
LIDFEQAGALPESSNLLRVGWDAACDGGMVLSDEAF